VGGVSDAERTLVSALSASETPPTLAEQGLCRFLAGPLTPSTGYEISATLQGSLLASTS